MRWHPNVYIHLLKLMNRLVNIRKWIITMVATRMPLMICFVSIPMIRLMTLLVVTNKQRRTSYTMKWPKPGLSSIILYAIAPKRNVGMIRSGTKSKKICMNGSHKEDRDSSKMLRHIQPIAPNTSAAYLASEICTTSVETVATLVQVESAFHPEKLQGFTRHQRPMTITQDILAH